MSRFSPGNMPDMGDFNPEGADGSSSKVQPPSEAQANGNASDSFSDTTEKKHPSLSGIPDKSSNQVKVKNLITLGAYLVVMLVILFAMKRIKRK